MPFQFLPAYTSKLKLSSNKHSIVIFLKIFPLNIFSVINMNITREISVVKLLKFNVSVFSSAHYSKSICNKRIFLYLLLLFRAGQKVICLHNLPGFLIPRQLNFINHVHDFMDRHTWICLKQRDLNLYHASSSKSGIFMI